MQNANTAHSLKIKGTIPLVQLSSQQKQNRNGKSLLLSMVEKNQYIHLLGFYVWVYEKKSHMNVDHNIPVCKDAFDVVYETKIICLMLNMKQKYLV